MDDLELTRDWELIPDDEYQFHKYMEAETAEADAEALKKKMEDDEYVFHVMGPEYFLSN
jgi:hypothetical protein